jgi:hypothetical protein
MSVSPSLGCALTVWISGLASNLVSLPFPRRFHLPSLILLKNHNVPVAALMAFSWPSLVDPLSWPSLVDPLAFSCGSRWP